MVPATSQEIVRMRELEAPTQAISRALLREARDQLLRALCDAITSERPYTPCFPILGMLERIRQQAHPPAALEPPGTAP
jgi:hypothetical protein